MKFDQLFQSCTVIMVGLACLGCGGAEQADAIPTLASAGTIGPMKVSTIKPTLKTLTRRTEQPGQIEAFEITPLYAKVTGYVKKLHVDIGDLVKGPKFNEKGELVEAGQVLVELDVPEIHDELRQHEAAVQLASAACEQARAAVKVAESKKESSLALVEEAKAGMAAAEATVTKWKTEHDRITKLVEAGTVTQKLMDESTSQLQAAEAERGVMSAKITSAQASSRQAESDIEKAVADVKAAEAELALQKAELQRTATMLRYANIHAPFDGVVSARNIHTGHLVSIGTAAEPMLVVARTDRLRLAVDVPETDAVHVQTKNEVKLRIPSMPGEPIPAVISRTQWSLQQGSRTLRCEIDLDNQDGKLRSGMYVYADITVAEHVDALTIPRAAVMMQETQAVCYGLDASNRIIKLPITVGLRVGTEAEVLAGLSNDTPIIAANVSSLREGQEVEVANP